MAKPVSVPLLNPNEPEAILAALYIENGQHISKGDPLCTLETTKVTADLPAEEEGYVAGLRLVQGQTVSAGEILCYLADKPDWTPPEPLNQPVEVSELPTGLRITQPALTLARRHLLDLNRLPHGPLVTESMVKALLHQSEHPVETLPTHLEFDPSTIFIYGGGGHGKMVIDLLRSTSSYNLAGIVDDDQRKGETVMGVAVLGGKEVLPDLYARGIHLAANAVAGIGNIAVRIKIFNLLVEAGFTCPAVVHRAAFMEPGAALSAGAQVFALAYVGSDARVGFGTIISTGAIVSHDCVLGDYVILSPGAILAGNVQVGSNSLIGMSATVNLGVKIGEGVKIGNGATVKKDVPTGALIQAGTIWPK